MQSFGVLCLLVLCALVLIDVFSSVEAKKRYDNTQVEVLRGKHEYNKYSREFSDESALKKQKTKKGSSKRLQLDLDNVNEDELNSDERAVLEYRRKKLQRQNKVTLTDKIQEKKQKNKQRKEKFEKNVLKHFKREDKAEATVSSEEVITPLKRVKIAQTDPDECNSSEEKCP